MSEREVPYYLEGALQYIKGMWPDNPSPFENSGERFDNERFSVHAYSWGDEDQPWNFKWRDLEVSWYKYLGRGMRCNRVPEPQEVKEMVNEVLTVILPPQPTTSINS